MTCHVDDDEVQYIREHISLDPAVSGGEPLIRGTDVSLYDIMATIWRGYHVTSVRLRYGITSEDVTAATYCLAICNHCLRRIVSNEYDGPPFTPHSHCVG
jgi:uncharacterized protein (DUF433 family)